MKENPFWVDDFRRPNGTTTEPPPETDYLVVGGGLTGLSAALRLAKSGASVTVIDENEAGGGASSANGGVVSVDIKAGVDDAHAFLGPQVAAEMWKSSIRSLDLVRGLNETSEIDALIHRSGLATLGRGPRQLRTFDRKVDWYRERFAVEWEILDARRIGEVIGGDSFNVAIFQPEAFGIHPERFVAGLLRQVTIAGAQFVRGTRAVAMEKIRAGLKVMTARGDEIRAGTVILATNGYTTRQPSKELARLVVPVGSYMIATEPIDSALAERMLPRGVMVQTHSRMPIQIRRSHDDRILVGGRRSLRIDADLEAAARHLEKRLNGVWPEITGVKTTHAWSGRVGMSFDLTPHIGRIDGAWYVNGFSGQGIGLGVQLGHELAGMLLGEDPPSVFATTSHSGRFYYSGRNS